MKRRGDSSPRRFAFHRDRSADFVRRSAFAFPGIVGAARAIAAGLPATGGGRVALADREPLLAPQVVAALGAGLVFHRVARALGRVVVRVPLVGLAAPLAAAPALVAHDIGVATVLRLL